MNVDCVGSGLAGAGEAPPFEALATGATVEGVAAATWERASERAEGTAAAQAMTSDPMRRGHPPSATCVSIGLMTAAVPSGFPSA